MCAPWGIFFATGGSGGDVRVWDIRSVSLGNLLVILFAIRALTPFCESFIHPFSYNQLFHRVSVCRTCHPNTGLLGVHQQSHLWHTIIHVGFWDLLAGMLS